MFDLVRNNKKVSQLLLALITVPFAFFGIESYVRDASSGAELASVGDTKITPAEFQNALREHEDRLRQQSGGRLDPAMFQAPAMRRAVLESVINQRLLALQAKDNRMTISDPDLARFIAAVPALQDNGKFSPERYAALVASQNLSREAFEQRLRFDLAMQQVAQPSGEAVIPGKASAMRWAQAQLEQREIAEYKLAPEAYLAKVSLSDDAVGKYYEANRSRFELPEQVRVEYLTLSQEALLSDIRIGDDEVKTRYEAKSATYKEPESRRASHILITAAKSAAEAEVKAAQAKAEGLLVAIRKAPGDFVRLAREHSQDPGSAAKGGDLDWFGRGMMVKPFEDSVFSLKEGETSEIVRSDFGFHIIRLTGIRPEKIKALADVRSEILGELQREVAAKKFLEAVEGFGNTVYEQSDSLKPAAEKWKLAPKNSDWLSKGKPLPPPFDNAKLGAALFSDDAIKNKRNTEAVEVAPGRLVSARVIEHRPATLQSLDTVKDSIRKQLQTEEAAKLAQNAGNELIGKLSGGEEVKLAWTPPRSVLRAAPAGLAPEAAKAIFKADAAKLPAFVGASLPGGGFAVYRISAVKSAGENEPFAASFLQQYERLIAEEEFAGWISELRRRYPVKVNTAALDAK